MPEPTQPIIVGESALPTTLAAALRYAIVTGLTYAVGRGWIDADNVEGITAALIAVAVAGYGLYKTHSNRAKLTVAAEAAPNTVAKVE